MALGARVTTLIKDGPGPSAESSVPGTSGWEAVTQGNGKVVLLPQAQPLSLRQMAPSLLLVYPCCLNVVPKHTKFSSSRPAFPVPQKYRRVIIWSPGGNVQWQQEV